MTVGEERRQALRAVALVALLRSIDGDAADPDDVLSAGPVGAAVVRDGRADVLVESGSPAVVAGVVLWADRHGADHIRLIVDESSGDAEGAAAAARWAACFDVRIDVFRRVDATAVPVDGPVVAPDRSADGSADGPVADDPTLRALLAAAGLEVVEEHGVVTGELLGLEVARLVRWPAELGGDGLVHVETGVGRFDRDATAAVRTGESPEAALRRTVAQVAAHRRPEDPGHPLSLLARERWLRRSLVDDPAVLGLAALAPVATTSPPTGIRDPAPAAAVGEDLGGGPVVVACSVGADLSFVPVAADTRAEIDPTAALLLVVPQRDVLASTRRLAELVRGGAEVRGVVAPWDGDGAAGS